MNDLAERRATLKRGAERAFMDLHGALGELKRRQEDALDAIHAARPFILMLAVGFLVVGLLTRRRAIDVSLPVRIERRPGILELAVSAAVVHMLHTWRVRHAPGSGHVGEHSSAAPAVTRAPQLGHAGTARAAWELTKAEE